MLLSVAAASACTGGEARLARDLRSDDTAAACGAAYVIGLRGRADADQGAALLARATAGDAGARYALWALGEIRDPLPGRREHLLRLLHDDRAEIRAGACRALGHLLGGDPAVRAALRPLTEDDHPAVADLARAALGDG
jgi:hypothetical protein